MAILSMCDIYYRTSEREILSGLSLSIEAGEIHALLGTNGTGKSTLASLIMGCQGYQPASGTIFFAGVVLNDLKIDERARLGICMAWQEPARFEGLRVQEYLTLGKSSNRPERCLHLVGLEPSLYLGRMVDRSLSGGERKRVELASVLALQPKLAILDEPDSGIDIVSTVAIIRVLNCFRNSGSAVLLITHRHEIAAIADRASCICSGRIVYTGSPAQVTACFKTRKCIRCAGEGCTNERI
ncbi:MAG: ABC transporter ATP-binding protein [Geobacter sp.]|nr:ABC transporter ATP-binding protein [Geobacter sp.]